MRGGGEHSSIKAFDCERGGGGVFGNRNVQEYLTTIKAHSLGKLTGIRVEQTKTKGTNFDKIKLCKH